MHTARPAAVALALLLASSQPALAETPAGLLAAYTNQAGSAPVPERGEKLFTTNFGRDLGLSCSSCHGAVPVRTGKDAITGKLIAPMAPAANPKRFTDAAKADYWFALNCKDFVGRECTAAEKADVLAWLVSLKP